MVCIPQSTRTRKTADRRFAGRPESADRGSEVQVPGFRYYNTELGRWVRRDPIWERGGTSLYLYVSNGAPNRWDLLGLTTPEPEPADACCIPKGSVDKGKCESCKQAVQRSATYLSHFGAATGCYPEIMCTCDPKTKQRRRSSKGFFRTDGVNRGTIDLYYNNIEESGSTGCGRVWQVMVHELQHMRDHCRRAGPGRGWWRDSSCAACMCREMRAYYCSSECGDLPSCYTRALASCTGVGDDGSPRACGSSPSAAQIGRMRELCGDRVTVPYDRYDQDCWSGRAPRP